MVKCNVHVLDPQCVSGDHVSNCGGHHLLCFFLQLIDEQGVNRTPKPLVAIVTSAALRQARGIVTEESVAGSDAGDSLFGEGLSSAGFSRGWFDSGTATPQEVDPQEYQGRPLTVCMFVSKTFEGSLLTGCATNCVCVAILK
jgi:hypothetical protein